MRSSCGLAAFHSDSHRSQRHLDVLSGRASSPLNQSLQLPATMNLAQARVRSSFTTHSPLAHISHTACDWLSNVKIPQVVADSFTIAYGIQIIKPSCRLTVIRRALSVTKHRYVSMPPNRLRLTRCLGMCDLSLDLSPSLPNRPICSNNSRLEARIYSSPGLDLSSTLYPAEGYPTWGQVRLCKFNFHLDEVMPEDL